MKKKRISNEDIVKMYAKKSCNVSSTCTALGISRQTFYDWKEKYPELKKALDEEDESILDWAETKLIEQVNEGNLTALIFFLKTKGKKRGYVESFDANVTANPFEQLMKELPDDE
ncbi:MAG: transposase [Bacteroidaceae bacterium]|nr:transposase [Bacteroidaceae bacterium]